MKPTLPDATARFESWIHRGERKPDGLLTRCAVVVLVALLSVSGVEAKPKDKGAAPKRDALSEYIRRVSGPPSVAPVTTAGSLWIDSGRLANMVADYKASRVGDLVTISIAQNLSSTSTGDVATSRNFSASSGITALPGLLKTKGVANLFSPTSAQALAGKGQATTTTALSTTPYRPRRGVVAWGNSGDRSGAADHDERAKGDRSAARAGSSRRYGRDEYREFEQRGRSGS